MTRLRVGQRLRYDGRVWRVEYVNACRARIVPVDKQRVEYTTLDGKPVTFEAGGRAVNISPTAGVELL